MQYTFKCIQEPHGKYVVRSLTERLLSLKHIWIVVKIKQPVAESSLHYLSPCLYNYLYN